MLQWPSAAAKEFLLMHPRSTGRHSSRRTAGSDELASFSLDFLGRKSAFGTKLEIDIFGIVKGTRKSVFGKNLESGLSITFATGCVVVLNSGQALAFEEKVHCGNRSAPIYCVVILPHLHLYATCVTLFSPSPSSSSHRASDLSPTMV